MYIAADVGRRAGGGVTAADTAAAVEGSRGYGDGQHTGDLWADTGPGAGDTDQCAAHGYQ